MISAAEYDWAQTGVLGAVVLAVMWSGLKGKWIFGHTHDRIVASLEADLERTRADRDKWQSLALQLAGITEQAVDRASRVVYAAEKAEP